MTPEELRAIMAYLMDRVQLAAPQAGPTKGENPEGAAPEGENPEAVAEAAVAITFQAPTEEEMISAGLNAEGVSRILRVPWWEEMVEDIVETPDMCDPDDSPQQVLEYAKDVVSEYVRKRFPLEGE